MSRAYDNWVHSLLEPSDERPYVPRGTLDPDWYRVRRQVEYVAEQRTYEALTEAEDNARQDEHLKRHGV